MHMIRRLFSPLNRQLRAPTEKLQVFCTTSITSRNYTPEEQVTVLNILNTTGDSTRTIVNKNLTEKLSVYIRTKGQLRSLEELLKVPGFGPKTLRKVCDELLNGTVPDTNEKPFARSTTVSNLTKPLLNKEKLSSLKLIGALHIGVNSISWAVVNLAIKEVLQWRTIPLPEVDKKTGLLLSLAKVKEIHSSLSEIDICVFEDVSWSSLVGSQTSIPLTIHRAQLLSMFVTLFNSEEGGDSIRTVFLKSRLTARVFNRLVGSERVSYQSITEDLLQQNSNGSHSNVYVGSQLRSDYFRESAPHRESLSEALLLAICFMDVVVYRRTDILDSIKVKRKNK